MLPTAAPSFGRGQRLWGAALLRALRRCRGSAVAAHQPRAFPVPRPGGPPRTAPAHSMGAGHRCTPTPWTLRPPMDRMYHCGLLSYPGYRLGMSSSKHVPDWLPSSGRRLKGGTPVVCGCLQGKAPGSVPFLPFPHIATADIWPHQGFRGTAALSGGSAQPMLIPNALSQFQRVSHFSGAQLFQSSMPSF